MSGAIRAFGAGVNADEDGEDAAAKAAYNADYVNKLFALGDEAPGGRGLDFLLIANCYSLLNFSAAGILDECEARGVAVVIGGPFSSGILATGPDPPRGKAMYNYRPASDDVRATARRIEAICKRHGVPLGHPASHPFRPLTALRVSQRAVAGEHQPAVVSALFHHGWVEGGELGDDAAIRDALTRAGLDGDALVAAANQPPAKEALKEATADAIEHGVFGVPTLSVDGELFWGSDRIDDALAHRDGELVITDDDVRDAMTMPATAQRKRGS